MYRGKVLLAYDESPAAHEAISILENNFFDVSGVKDGRQAGNEFIENEGKFDCVLVKRDLPLGNAFDVVKTIREYEKEQRKRERNN